MRVAVLGAGAMGAIFGSAFRRVGAEVVFSDKRSDVVEAIISEGLFLDGKAISGVVSSGSEIGWSPLLHDLDEPRPPRTRIPSRWND